MLTLWFFAFIGLAHAVPGAIRPVTTTTVQPPATIEDLALDLDNSDRPTRLLAARELRRRARLAAKGGGRPGSIAELESRAELAALIRVALPACAAVLGEPGLAVPCADVLARLDEPGSCGPLRAARATAEPRVARAMNKALARLGPTCAVETP